MVSIKISAAGKPVSLARGLPYAVDLPGKQAEDATIGDVKVALAAKYPKFYPSRQKITLKDDKKLLPDETTLANAGLVDGGEVSVKDLGPQVSWRTVFVVEYVGPLIIHPLVYHLPNIFYGGQIQHSLLQKYIYSFVLLHFIKRELETLFVHRFSHGTMPFRNIFKNSAHYHLLSGILLAYAIYSPTYAATSPYIQGTYREEPKFLQMGAAIWLFAELSNLTTHITLRNLRPVGTRERKIPYGYGFSFVSCPNYLFEFIGWLVVAVMTGSYAVWIFLAVSTYYMYMWALKKHRTYKREFGDKYPRGRKAMFPLLL
ncbi:hypothetical protein SERLA73DRAFT_168792 [Serpula lacrymans var. lacrymans S7.3]|uniref:very-long-chain enoyl-CoA reductase n=2 Tax=Serpula lacrymans var. lacrymans TaxID=341189 RepID=F8PWX9_SERL3|nr:uncharacterized protein SERLADRAFT_449601 [Serpula lacrymans var. lacrymans S7.9]EGN99306.1 hypothetical protein SERLA73DRAFT_168792 [Serpula lacrymans var. lacrymans S7.3]EGO24870.1 hypothetical protein SERLADRAFT_449601 [Serpula lacrymans var. lacrymans S7.9]